MIANGKRNDRMPSEIPNRSAGSMSEKLQNFNESIKGYLNK